MNARSTKLSLLLAVTAATVDSRKLLLRSRNLIKDGIVAIVSSADKDEVSQVELFNELSASFVTTSLASEETGEESIIAIDSLDDATSTTIAFVSDSPSEAQTILPSPSDSTDSFGRVHQSLSLTYHESMSTPDVSQHEVPIHETPELIDVSPTDLTDLSISMSMPESEEVDEATDLSISMSMPESEEADEATDLSISMSMPESEEAEVTIDVSAAPSQLPYNDDVVTAEGSMNLHLLRQEDTDEARNDNIRLIIGFLGLVTLLALALSLVYFSSKRKPKSLEQSSDNVPDPDSLEYEPNACSSSANDSFDRLSGEINASTEDNIAINASSEEDNYTSSISVRTSIREEWICVDGMVKKKVTIGSFR